MDKRNIKVKTGHEESKYLGNSRLRPGPEQDGIAWLTAANGLLESPSHGD